MLLLRLLLLPFTLLYGTGIFIRNLLYKAGVLTRMDFEFPIICVGNISAGGTGKTPHIEWIIAALKDHYKLAVLSRGYMRKTTGYVLADGVSTAADIGDEPLQIKQKFRDVPVAVSENRVLGVPDLLADAPDTEVILMDDGFQHLSIKPGFNIILTPFDQLFTRDWLLPSGRLREFRSAYKRADMIIVTKCPDDISKQKQEQLVEEIKPLAHQQVFFTGIRYSTELVHVFNKSTLAVAGIGKHQTIGFAGIARHALFEQQLQKHTTLKHFMRFSDHHTYTDKELKDLSERLALLQYADSLLVTTEKDAKRLQGHAHKHYIEQLPVYYWPMEIYFINQNGQELLNAISNYVHSTNQ